MEEIFDLHNYIESKKNIELFTVGILPPVSKFHFITHFYNSSGIIKKYRYVTR